MPPSLFRRAGPRTRGASHDRRRLVRRVTGLRDQRVEIAMMRMPDGHGRIEPRAFYAASGRRSPERTGQRPRLPPRHVRGGRPRRYAGPAPRARRATRRRSGPVRRGVSALLHTRPRGHSHRAGRANRLTPRRARGREVLARRGSVLPGSDGTAGTADAQRWATPPAIGRFRRRATHTLCGCCRCGVEKIWKWASFPSLTSRRAPRPERRAAGASGCRLGVDEGHDLVARLPRPLLVRRSGSRVSPRACRTSRACCLAAVGPCQPVVAGIAGTSTDSNVVGHDLGEGRHVASTESLGMHSGRGGCFRLLTTRTSLSRMSEEVSHSWSLRSQWQRVVGDPASWHTPETAEQLPGRASPLRPNCEHRILVL